MCFIRLLHGSLNLAKQVLGAKLEDQDEPLVNLAMAIISYNEGQVKATLNHLKNMVELNPRSPPEVWLGIGICFFKLKNLVKAKFSFEQVLELDPQNS